MNEENKNEDLPLKIPDFSKVEVSKTVIENSIAEDAEIDTKQKTDEVKNMAADYVFSGLVFLILSFLILMGVYFVYNYASIFLETKEKAQEQNLVFENPLVRGDRSRVVSLEAGANKETVRNILIQALKNERVKEGEISLIMPSYLRDTLVNNERKLIAELQRGDDFFFTFAVRSPLNLRAIASEKYALGNASNKNFFAFSVNSAPDAAREMLRYESQIYSDMLEVLNLRELKGDFVFKDLSDNNHLLRVGTDDEGVVLVYGFASPGVIVVASDTQTFHEVYTHLK